MVIFNQGKLWLNSIQLWKTYENLWFNMIWWCLMVLNRFKSVCCRCSMGLFWWETLRWKPAQLGFPMKWKGLVPNRCLFPATITIHCSVARTKHPMICQLAADIRKWRIEPFNIVQYKVKLASCQLWLDRPVPAIPCEWILIKSISILLRQQKRVICNDLKDTGIPKALKYTKDSNHTDCSISFKWFRIIE